ncbi:MAG: prephenate dehydratase [Gammaproteobacteria bacterium]|nr:prephenate dehydratase [Gammaproteobacteria bacterium]
MSDKHDLASLRQQIDAVDQQLHQLLNQRAQLAQEVGHTKIKLGDPVFYRPEREADVLRAVQARNQGPIGNEEIARLFREIMSVCLSLEMPMNIAYLGPAGTYTQAAALKQFGHSVKTHPVNAIDEIFREVESGNCHYGVVPVENSTEGMVNQTLDMFMRSPLVICGEIELRVEHHLISQENELKAIKKIYSHQQSFAQCREWLSANMFGVQCEVVNSNGEAAKLASEQTGTAAIAGETAAQIYQLNSLVKNIEDEPINTTRFLVIGKRLSGPSGQDKTSLMLSARNRPGALLHLLEPFSKRNISMTKIESRPSRKGMWDYVFFVDIEGHAEEEPVKSALTEIEQEAALYKLLGAYPRKVF